MGKDLIKRPVKWFTLETISNFLYERLVGPLWRSAVVVTLYTLAQRYFYATPPDIRFLVGLFLLVLIFFVAERLISRRKKRAVHELEQAAPIEDKKEVKEAEANHIQMGVLQCGIVDADTGEGIRGATCVAQHEQTKQEYIGDTNADGVLILRVPHGFYVVKIKAPQYGTRVEAVHLAGKDAFANVDVELTKIQGGKASKGPCADEWLHKIAEQDRDDLSKSVRIVSCESRGCDLLSDQPHALFEITVFNGSVFNIAMDRNVGGFISYGGHDNGYQRLRGDTAMTGKWRVTECARYYYIRFEIQQWFTPDDLKVVAEGSEGRRFNFQLRDLIINVIGGPGTSGVRPSPLSFHNFELVRFP